MARYTYVGGKDTSPALVGLQCDPVLRADGKCIVNQKMATALVIDTNGYYYVVLRRRLRLNKREEKTVERTCDYCTKPLGDAACKSKLDEGKLFCSAACVEAWERQGAAKLFKALTLLDESTGKPVPTGVYEAIEELERKRVTTIRADQWPTIEADVQAGRCVVREPEYGMIIENVQQDNSGTARLFSNLSGAVYTVNKSISLFIEWLDTPPASEPAMDDVTEARKRMMNRIAVNDTEFASDIGYINARLDTLQAENVQLREQVANQERELQARREILEMAVKLKAEILPGRVGNGWIDSIEQLAEMAKDEQQRANALQHMIAEIRDASLEPQDAIFNEWVGQVMGCPDCVSGLVKARMEQAARLRAALKPFADAFNDYNVAFEAGYGNGFKNWLQERKLAQQQFWQEYQAAAEALKSGEGT